MQSNGAVQKEENVPFSMLKFDNYDKIHYFHLQH